MQNQLRVHRRGGPPVSESPTTTTRTSATLSRTTTRTASVPKEIPVTESQSSSTTPTSSAPIEASTSFKSSSLSTRRTSTVQTIGTLMPSSNGATIAFTNSANSSPALPAASIAFIALGSIAALLLLVAMVVYATRKRSLGGNRQVTTATVTSLENAAPPARGGTGASRPMTQVARQPPQEKPVPERPKPAVTASSRFHHPQFSPPPQAIPSHIQSHASEHSDYFTVPQKRLVPPPRQPMPRQTKYPYYIPDPKTVAHAYLMLNEDEEDMKPLIDFRSPPPVVAPIQIPNASLVSPMVPSENGGYSSDVQVSIASALSSTTRNELMDMYAPAGEQGSPVNEPYHR
ncbi:hypothetical protein HDU80_005881 [Chytriomyces hyalinus]|nr:hypothetical protein HDU80_005881 [Chytriomyces hyalinus]